MIDLFKRTGKRFFAKDTFEMGAALAYYTVFSLAPLVLIAISIAGEIIATYNANFGQHTASAEPIAKLLPASRRSQAI